jgi:hypothetical protein
VRSRAVAARRGSLSIGTEKKVAREYHTDLRRRAEQIRGPCEARVARFAAKEQEASHAKTATASRMTSRIGSGTQDASMDYRRIGNGSSAGGGNAAFTDGSAANRR